MAVEQAAAAGIPPYLVLSNSTLRAVCRVRPQQVPQLLTIPGIGPAKAERYGAALLTAVAGEAARSEPAPVPAAAPAEPPPALLDASAEALRARLLEGATLDELLDAAGAQRTAVINQLTALVRHGAVTPAQVLGDETARSIALVLAAEPGISLPEAREQLGPDVPYHAIRWVRAAMVRSPAAAEPPPPLDWLLKGGRAGAREVAASIEAAAGAWPLLLAVDLGHAHLPAVAELSRELALPVQFTATEPDGTPRVAVDWPAALLLVGPPGRVLACAPKLAGLGVGRVGTIRLLDGDG